MKAPPPLRAAALLPLFALALACAGKKTGGEDCTTDAECATNCCLIGETYPSGKFVAAPRVRCTDSAKQPEEWCKGRKGTATSSSSGSGSGTGSGSGSGTGSGSGSTSKCSGKPKTFNGVLGSACAPNVSASGASVPYQCARNASDYFVAAACDVSTCTWKGRVCSPNLSLKCSACNFYNGCVGIPDCR